MIFQFIPKHIHLMNTKITIKHIVIGVLILLTPGSLIIAAIAGIVSFIKSRHHARITK